MPVRQRIPLPPNALRFLLAGLAAAACVIAWPVAVSAEKPTIRYVFLVSRVDLPKEAPKELAKILRKEVSVAIGKEPLLVGALPADAPHYDESEKGRYGNKAFRKYMHKHDLRAFNVTIRVTNYQPTLKPNPNKAGQILGSSIILQMFGETIPERVMAFSGDGSATVLAEIGNKLRPGDRKWADTDAATLAIDKALAMSLVKLATKPKAPPAKRKRQRQRQRRTKK